MTFSKEDLIGIMEVFRAESSEHIQRLNSGFLELEKNPKQPGLIDEIFRSAHSLKGAARMMGFRAIEDIAHKLESVLSMARREEIDLTTEIIDLLYRGLDTIGQIVEVLSHGGSESEIQVDSLLASLTGLVEGMAENRPERSKADQDSATAVTNPEDNPPPMESSQIVATSLETQSETSATQPSEEEMPVTVEKPNIDPWERRRATPLDEGEVVGRRRSDVLLSESIRVSTQRLDDMMNQVGDLLTSRIKSSQRLVETQSIIDYLEDWSRKWQLQKEHVARLSKSEANGESRHVLRFLLENAERLNSTLGMLGSLHQSLKEDNMRLSLTTDELEESVKKARMMPLSVVLETFPRMVRDLAKESGKEVELVLDGSETELDKRILEEMKDPLIHLVRNSIDHGLELPDVRAKVGKPRVGTVTVRAMQRGNTVAIEVEDDGAGLNTQTIKETALRKGLFQERELENMSEAQVWNVIFAPSFSTSNIITNVSGRGIGMDVVRANVEGLKGLIKVESERGAGVRFTMILPLTLATTQILIIDLLGTFYAIPATAVETTIRVTKREIFTVAGKTAICYEGAPVALAFLADALELSQRQEDDSLESMPVVLAGSAESRIAFAVDRLVGEEQVVVRGLGPYLKQVRNISGATTLGDGSICLVLNVADLIRSVQHQKTRAIVDLGSDKVVAKTISALVVDDSITTRTLEKNILESVGFDVTTAVDGLDAFNKLNEKNFDIVVCDVEMPNMNGFELASKIRSDPELRDLPFILVTSLESDEDKRRGMEVGANAYLTKSTFDQSNLLDTIRRLV